ncbi:translocation/assembly module TamB [Sinomicrobium sp. FJxs]|uniref:Translocation/assembly module TamB n=2 Tax=Sinomicrobium weinanense TaxID=2842200 RepID=A0A926Q390_9FLAO|nr:translocation/assembly module TamB domain-containing protein [Sinomicrobium weinanense]MBC9795505.1 translocation/assembly module TamB [Sinomicrobium weinanense]MBU3123348.1 translocation/assembly module TamB [Sinomicrobium weinanense]
MVSIFLALPPVQTNIANRVTRALNEDFGTNIQVKRVYISFFGSVSLRGIYIADHHRDTLISVKRLNTSLLSVRNVKSMVDGKLNFGDIDLEGVLFNLKTYKDEEDTNLDVFVEKLESPDTTSSSEPFLLTTSRIDLEDARFKLIDENTETPEILDFQQIKASLHDFKIEGPEVTAAIRQLGFVAERGIEVEKLETDFSYGLEAMHFDDLSIETSESNIQGNLSFFYNREDFSDFLNKVKVQGMFEDATIAFDEINTFYNEFGRGKRVTFTSKVDGVLNNLNAGNLRVTTENTSISGNFNFKGLFSSNIPFKMDANIGYLSSNYHQLRGLLPNILGNSLPSSLARLGQLRARGKAVLTETAIRTDLELETDLGSSVSNLELTEINDIDNASYVGTITTTEFDLGQFIEDDNFGKTSLRLDVDGKGFTEETLNTEIRGTVDNIVYNGYNYKDVTVSGIVKDQLFDGSLVSNDENFTMSFDGLADFAREENQFDFRASITHADLHALHFVSRDSISVFSGDINMNITGNDVDNLKGEVSFARTSYKNQNDNYYFEDFKIISVIDTTERVITVDSPEIINGFMKGNFSFRELGKIVQNSVGSIYANYNPYEIQPDQYVEFNFFINSKIIEVFFPQVKIGKNTYVKGEMVADEGDFKFNFRSPDIDAFGNALKGIDLQIDNKNPLFNTYVEIGEINTGFYDISGFNLINTTIKDTLFFRTEFKGGDGFKDAYNLNFYHTITPDNKSVVGLKRSEVGFKGNKWLLNKDNNHQNRVVFNKTLDTISIEEVVMNYEDEQINLQGKLIDSTYKDLSVQFKNVSLDKVTPSVENLDLKGVINGEFYVLQRRKNYYPSSNLRIDDFTVNETNLGNFDMGIVGSQDFSSYGIDAVIEKDSKKVLDIVGNVAFENDASSLDLRMSLNELNMAAFSLLGEDVISDIRGLISGEARLTGTFAKPDLNGQLTLQDAGLRIPYLNVNLDFNPETTVDLFGQTFQFKDVTLTDTEYKTRALFNGTITHTGFSDWYLDMSLDTQGKRFLALNTPETEEELFYGTGFINGEAQIYGLTDELTIKMFATTGKGTSLKIPLDNEVTVGDTSFINFIDKNAEASFDAHERGLADYKGLELEFDLDINPDAEVEIVIDKELGSSLKGRGAGNILMEINTNGKFRMWGDFTTYSGDYNFKYGGIIEKKFKVKPGGFMSWNGDPDRANVDLEAVYSLNANPAVLLDNNSVTRKIATDLIIKLNGELLKPDIDFDIQFPGTNAVINSELQYKLDDKSKRELQALSLLSQGAFINNEINITRGGVAGNFIESGFSMLNDILNSGDGKFDVGLSYELGTRDPNLDFETQDRFGVTVSTQISERILINGKIGVPIGGVAETAVAGDVEVQILLNEDGTLRARIFNRENEIQQWLADRIGYTQGAGLSYQVDFNTFRELLRKIFKAREKNTEKPDVETEAKKEASTGEDTMGGGLIHFGQKKS